LEKIGIVGYGLDEPILGGPGGTSVVMHKHDFLRSQSQCSADWDAESGLFPVTLPSRMVEHDVHAIDSHGWLATGFGLQRFGSIAGSR